MEKAFDGDISTAWVEGAEGPGTGQRIAFKIDRGAAEISIFPGYGDERYFYKNFRVKTARLEFYFLEGVGPENYVVSADHSVTFELRDSMSLQKFSLTGSPSEKLSDIFDFTRPALHDVIGVLTIESVYPTGQWEDTCIAEIQIE